MPSIFLSHNSADKPFVRRLAECLTEAGAMVWLDEAQLQIGDSLIDRISTAIQEVDFVAAVISRNSIRSAWVRKELSLALTKELHGNRAVVLPVVIDDCELPPTLTDKLFADFRNPASFDNSVTKLLRAMGLRVDRKNYRTGIAVEWTDEGPRIFGKGVSISPSESNALLDRWSEWLPKFMKRESEEGTPEDEIFAKGNLLAMIRACFETYGRVPDEEEMNTGESELARKVDLLFLFNAAMIAETFSEELDMDIEEYESMLQTLGSWDHPQLVKRINRRK